MEDLSELKSKLTVETTGDFRSIELTDEQYERLITLLKIGIRVAHSAKENEFNIPLIDIDQYINSFAKQFNAEHLIVCYEELGGVYTASDLLNLKIAYLQESYLDNYFFNQLSERLTARDLIRNPVGMRNQILEKVSERIKSSYAKEFDEHGLENLLVSGAENIKY